MTRIIQLTFIFLFFSSHLSSFSQSLPKVSMKSELGTFIVEVDTLNAPITGKNFLQHVQSGILKDALFYRVVRMDNQPQNHIKIQVIQGGLYNSPRVEKIKPIPHETTTQTGIKHKDGTISMARLDPGSASTEFFICIGNQPELDFGGKRNPDGQGFAAFGQVVEGMEVVRAIQKMEDVNQILVDKVEVSIDMLK